MLEECYLVLLQHLGISPENVPFAWITVRPFSVCWQSSVIVHWCDPMHVTLVVRQYIPPWDVRRNKLRYLVNFSARSKYCNPQNQRLVPLLFCSTLECHTLLYILRSCLVSWRTWWSDILTLPYPSTSELLGLEIVEDAYWGGNRIFLAIDIALTSKDSDRNLACVLELDAVVNSWEPYLSLAIVTPYSDMSSLK